jgi:hypothetical protein
LEWPVRTTLKRFIEVTTPENEKILVNLELIVTISDGKNPSDHKPQGSIQMTNHVIFRTIETLDELKQLIKLSERTA